MKTLDEFLSELRQLDVKLWVEGDRLRYRAAKETLTPEMLAQLRERKAEILTFLQEANTAARDNLSPILPVARNVFLPLSFAQQHLWLLHQFEPDSSGNNMPVVVRLTGSLNVKALFESLAEIVRRHEILRTTFPLVDGKPRQVISPDIALTLPLIDLQEFPPEQRETEAHRQATAEAQQPFDLATGPLLRVKLLRLTEEKHLLIWNMHGIVCDGSSSDLFFRELTAIYEAFSVGKPSPLPELPIQYADFAHWQRQRLQGEFLESQLDYWKQHLGGSLPLLQLPTDHPRPPVQTYRGDRGARMLPKTLHDALTTLSQRSGATLFMTLLAAFKTLLYRYSRQEDILVSFVNAGRNHVETEKLMGFFSNALMLRTTFEGNPSFRELLNRVRQGTLEAYAHQDLPFEKLVEELGQEKNQIRSPLLQVKFTLNPPWTQGRGMSSVKLPGLTIDSLFGYIYHGKTKFDLILVTREQDEGLGAVLDYNAEIFDADTIDRMLGHFQTLLEGIVANPEERLCDLPLLTAAEQLTLLVEWNDTQTNYPQDACIHQLFEAQVERTPDAVAVVFEDKQLTYWELNARANQLAHHLQSLGVGSEVLVGICVERSNEMVVALLGILKAGGAYVPLDPTYPQERLAFMVEDAELPIILTQQPLVEKLPGRAKVVCLDTDSRAINRESEENPTSGITADNLAYIMYTSGSTGEPNGVSVIHRGVVRLVKEADYASLNAEEVFLQLAPISFNASTFEIWGCLLNGARLALFPAHTPSLSELAQAIGRYQVTTLWLPAGLFHLMVDQRLEDLKPVRQLLTGGDVLSVSHVQKFRQKLADCKLINVYALTANTTFTCCYPITPTQIGNSVPIGRPIANTQVYLLDNHLQPVPVGVPGELYIGGEGLARGYLNRPDLTAEKFIPNPFNKSKVKNQKSKVSELRQADIAAMPDRLYKTGDLARYLPSGNIEYLGRLDHQMKIRGLRIELGEVESALAQHPAVQQTVVTARVDVPGDKRLVAYVVPNQEQATTSSELLRFLRQKLPTYMVPDAFVLLDALPLTPNGKVDRRTLPAPDQFSQDLEEPFVASRDQLELQLTKIWSEVLGIQRIGITDNFFDLGGNSLLAVRLFAQIEKTFDKNLPLATLLQAPTIEQLSSILRQSEWSVPWSPLVTIQKSGDKPPLFCIHGAGFNVLVYRDLATYLGSDQPVYGLQARGMDGKDAFFSQLEDIAADYIREMRTVQPEGPYFLAGLSNGGNLALEMAQQLHAQGQNVDLLAMFDSYGPDSIKLLPPIPRLLSSLRYALSYSVPSFVVKSLRLGPLAGLSEVLRKVRAFKNMSDEQRDKATVKQLKVGQMTDGTQHSPTNINYLEREINKLSKFILEHSPWAFFSVTAQLQDMEGSLPHTLTKLQEAHRKAQEAYVPKVYPGRITLFRASEEPPGFHLEPQLGWGKIAAGGLEIYEVPGHHSSILESPVLAEKLRACLARCEF